MRNRWQKISNILHFTGNLLIILAVLLLVPIIFTIIYWGQNNDGPVTLLAFLISSVISAAVGFNLKFLFKSSPMQATDAMLCCAIGWIAASAAGALPFVLGIHSGYLNAFFEAVSGFTTTGITVYNRLDQMPASILFWRSLIQWLGGIGILSFFLAIIFRSGNANHHLFGAESHKISAKRPVPGLANTVKILWGIYLLFTLLCMFALVMAKMPTFDAICHSLTTLSTGGFSTHDSSIAFYQAAGYSHFKLIEYIFIFFMTLGGINFLIHYRVLMGDFRALYDNIEIRYFWRIIAGFTAIILAEHFFVSGEFAALFHSGKAIDLAQAEQAFRHTLFQVISVLTTTGFGTRDIGASFFGSGAKQLFLVMMVIGGCVGSTGGGIKVLRITILNKLMLRELFKLRVSGKASNQLRIDDTIVSDDEIHRVSTLFFSWVALLLIGSLVTAFLSDHGPLEAASGMFSALGNIGPSYISVDDMISINPVIKITYILGMLAGRLEIIPVLLLFSPKAWR